MNSIIEIIENYSLKEAIKL